MIRTLGKDNAPGDDQTFFRGKKITLMGLGLLGRGVGDVKFLAEYGADLTVTDLKNEKELAPSLVKLRSYKLKAISYVLGRHRLRDFRNRDFILKAAGVPLDSPFIAEAKKNKTPVLMSTALFAKFAQERGVILVGVTGTRGKSTVTHLIYRVLKLAQSHQGQPHRGLSSAPAAPRRVLGKKIWLGGNVRGVSTLALLSKVRPGDIVVLELDSWQLQGFGDLKISPQIAVFTNFLDDHLNYYRGDKKRYWEDKANIFKWQKKGDWLTLGEQFSAKNFRPKADQPRAGKIIVVNRRIVPRGWKIKLLGKHNRNNVALAVKVAEILGVSRQAVKKAVENFRGVPGRLELVKTLGGVKFYNDTTATTPDAAIAALRALGSSRRRNIVLVAGGADKNLDLTPLLKEIPKYCKALILLPGSGSEKFKARLADGQAPSEKPKVEIKNLKEARNLGKAMKEARILARRGDIVLFSPGFASFGLFKNEFDRGEKFVGLVKKLFKNVQFPRPGL